MKCLVRILASMVVSSVVVLSCQRQKPVEAPSEIAARRLPVAPAAVTAVEEEPAVEEEARDLAFFLKRLINLDRLPVLEEGVQTKQFSSYDRKSRYDEATGKYVDWDANGDAGQYIRVEPSGEAVMAEMEGPGCIWRIWSANPKGKIRFYFDGSASPSYEFDFDGLFGGRDFPFPRPLLWQRRFDIGGENLASDCYVPIPFAKSCKVTADQAHGQYYHIGYSTFPKGWKVKTFRLPLSASEKGVLERVAKVLSNCGTDPADPGDSSQAIPPTTEGSLSLEPGKEAEILSQGDGPGTIRQFFAKVISEERWVHRKVLLRMYWDGEKEPSVDAPIGDFFGDAWGESPYKSLPLGIADDMNYCYWRMPFLKSARISIKNEARGAVKLRYRVVVDENELPPGAAHFHAKWRRDRKGETFDYPILEATGMGRFVGAALFPDNIVGDWWGEGDEKIYVDGEKFPSTFGTGSEDYFGDAWGIRRFANPFHGCPTPASFEAARRQSCYRWHISDSIPFTRSFVMTIENYTALGEKPARNDFSSMAYWYQNQEGKDSFRSTTLEERLPQGLKVVGAVEAERAAATPLPEGVSIISDEGLSQELSGGRALKMVGKPGLTVKLSAPAPVDGRFTIEPVIALKTGLCFLEVMKDGKVAGDRVSLSKGDNAIEGRLGGGEARPCEVVLDYLLIHPYRNFVREWYLIGPFANKNDEGLGRVYGPETDAFDASGSYPGKDGAVRWEKISVPSGIVAGNRFFKDNDDLVAYACCVITSPSTRKVTAYVGSDDGVKVWIGGKLVHSKHQHRTVQPDQDRFEVTLQRGENPVLIKVDQGGGPWGFCLRVDDPDDELKYKLP